MSKITKIFRAFKKQQQKKHRRQSSALSNTFTPEELSQAKFDYGNCKECNKPCTSYGWCRACNAQHFQHEFSNWTSDSNEIDHFIQYTQRAATHDSRVLEWIPYLRIAEMKEIRKGGYGTVYKAIWINGPITGWYKKYNQWYRQGDVHVALKSIGTEGDMTLDLDQLKTFYKHDVSLAETLRVYGFTQDPETLEYFLVMRYSEKGNLRHFIQTEFKNITWGARIEILYQIARNLNHIHKTGLIHQNLHTGNILKVGQYVTFISDIGQCRKKTDDFKKTYGVMPYLAPEVLCYQLFSPAADVYSFGLIMWELVSGEPPFAHQPHDADLAVQICGGLRPHGVHGVPKFYIDLMTYCWNLEPDKRPSTDRLETLLHDFHNFPGLSKIQNQLDMAEKFRAENPYPIPTPKIECHPLAFYTSRALPPIANLIGDSDSDSNDGTRVEQQDENEQKLKDEVLTMSDEQKAKEDAETLIGQNEIDNDKTNLVV